MQENKVVSVEALHIAQERTEAKSKGERYTQLNVEFERGMER